MKVAGKRKPSRGWFQRSSASAPHELARDEADLRLEGEQELAALDRFGQRLLGVDLLLVLGGKLGR